MLAPLKDRSLIEKENEAQLIEENTQLRRALRQAQQLRQRAALLAAQKIDSLAGERSHFEQLSRQLQARVEALESGLAITALAQQLVALRQENNDLHAANQQLWFLDRTLCAAHHECERLARERDAALAGQAQTIKN